MLSYTLTPYRGDTFRRRFVLWADHARTVPVDLTGVSVAAEIRATTGGPVITTIPCVVTVPQTIDISLSAAQSAQLPTTASWDLQLTYASGDVQTIIKGSVAASGDVTHSVTVPGVRAA